MIQVIYPFLVVAGLVIIGVLIYLNSLSKMANRVILEMIEINAESGHDPRAFLQDIKPLLKKIWIDDIFYTINFMNICIEDKPDLKPKRAIEIKIEREDYQITIGLLPRYSKGEHGFLNTFILEVISILVEMDILIRIKVITEAMRKVSRLQTFILHDVKNLAQFISVLSYNLHKIETADKKDRFIENLKETMPVITKSGAKIISALGSGKYGDFDVLSPDAVDLKALLTSIANLYRLRFTIKGEARVFTDELMITAVFDNILKNIYDKSRDDPNITCEIDIEQAEDKARIVISDSGEPIKEKERIFEPFYSTKKDGIGIGLYQAKAAVSAMKGEIRSLPQASGAAFEVILPAGDEYLNKM